MNKKSHPLRSRSNHLAGILAACALLPAFPLATQAQSDQAILDLLLKKGVISEAEAKDLRKATDKDFTKAFASKTGMPDWVTAVKINGDFRGRFEGFYAPNTAFVSRDRFRYRLRLGIVANLADDFEVGLRLTSSEASFAAGSPKPPSSGGDPLSGNTTLGANGSRKFIYLDLAYAKWNPLHNADWAATTTFGKMENPFSFPSTLVFDKDYTPEGFAQDLTYHFNPEQTVKWIGGGFAINELGGSSNDPYLAGTQLRLDSKWNKKLTSSVGVGWFGVLANNDKTGHSTLNSDALPDQQRGNSRDASGNPKAKFNPIYADASVTYALENVPFNTGAFPITVSGDYLHNPATSKDNDGYSAGVTFGKAGKKGTWELSYRFTELQADAWFEEFTESDFGAYYSIAPVGGAAGYGPGSNARGHVIKASYSPYNSLTFSVTLFATELINNLPPTPPITDVNSRVYRLQVDAVWKF
jgi:hypothetical protein